MVKLLLISNMIKAQISDRNFKAVKFFLFMILSPIFYTNIAMQNSKATICRLQDIYFQAPNYTKFLC